MSTNCESMGMFKLTLVKDFTFLSWIKNCFSYLCNQKIISNSFFQYYRKYHKLFLLGVNLNYVKGKKIGCFVGTSSDEVSNVLIDNVKGGYGLLGHARCMLANRISYWLNIKGKYTFIYLTLYYIILLLYIKHYYLILFSYFFWTFSKT